VGAGFGAGVGAGVETGVGAGFGVGVGTGVGAGLGVEGGAGLLVSAVAPGSGGIGGAFGAFSCRQPIIKTRRTAKAINPARKRIIDSTFRRYIEIMIPVRPMATKKLEPNNLLIVYNVGGVFFPFNRAFARRIFRLATFAGHDRSLTGTI
jgi:hypothetical protein